MESYNNYPKTLNDFLSYPKEITKEMLNLADKDFLIELCIILKEKELRNYIDKNIAINFIDYINKIEWFEKWKENNEKYS